MVVSIGWFKIFTWEMVGNHQTSIYKWLALEFQAFHISPAKGFGISHLYRKSRGRWPVPQGVLPPLMRFFPGGVYKKTRKLTHDHGKKTSIWIYDVFFLKNCSVKISSHRHVIVFRGGLMHVWMFSGSTSSFFTRRNRVFDLPCRPWEPTRCSGDEENKRRRAWWKFPRCVQRGGVLTKGTLDSWKNLIDAISCNHDIFEGE